MPEQNQLIPTALHQIPSGGDYNALVYCSFPIEYNAIQLYVFVLESGTGFSVQYLMWAVESVYLFQDLVFVCLNCYGPDVVLHLSSVLVHLYYLLVWGFS
jgi:hypothetical protein